MKSLQAALRTELFKVLKSKMLTATIAGFIFIPLLLGLLMLLARNPYLARQLGIVGAKAAMFTETDWPAYFVLLNQTVAVLGLIGFGFVLAWIFGREYVERTAKDLLALPVSRYAIVAAKFLVAAGWCILLACIFFVLELLMGWLVGLTGWRNELLLCSLYRFLFISLLTLASSTPAAFFASYGRGYLPPLAFVILTLIMANFVALAGLGPYFPWAIPGLYATSAGTAGAETTAGMQLNLASYTILFTTCLAGLAVTFAWWRFADQT